MKYTIIVSLIIFVAILAFKVFYNKEQFSMAMIVETFKQVPFINQFIKEAEIEYGDGNGGIKKEYVTNRTLQLLPLKYQSKLSKMIIGFLIEILLPYLQPIFKSKSLDLTTKTKVDEMLNQGFTIMDISQTFQEDRGKIEAYIKAKVNRDNLTTPNIEGGISASYKF